MKKSFYYIIALLLLNINPIFVQSGKSQNTQSLKSRETIIHDKAAKNKLIGKHRFSLQWISWDYFGKVTITEENKLLRIQGEQKQKKGSDFITLEGIITEVNKLDFKFNGDIITQVSYINKGKSCKRSGDMTFIITGNRKYWRLKEMNNPCEDVADYVDIFFK
jgi:hypothetical protein